MVKRRGGGKTLNGIGNGESRIVYSIGIIEKFEVCVYATKSREPAQNLRIGFFDLVRWFLAINQLSIRHLTSDAKPRTPVPAQTGAEAAERNRECEKTSDER